MGSGKGGRVFTFRRPCEQGETGASGAPAHVRKAKGVFIIFFFVVIVITIGETYVFSDAY